MDRNRPIRIAGASGSAADRRHAFTTLAQNYSHDPIDVIMGDWMSEANMVTLSGRKVSQSGEGPAYEASFLEALEPALPAIAQNRIKVAVNAGASDTKLLCDVVRKLVAKHGLCLNVAWVDGDDVLSVLKDKMEAGDEEFVNLCTGERLKDWSFEPIAAQAYLGGLGIAAGFENGADIVVCGRVSDASPVIGVAYWWHGWHRENLEELSNAFVAGHLIECSTYVCGGNFSGFKNLDDRSLCDIGYPIAEIDKTGSVVITKQKGTGGLVSEDTCKAQLLYEIQGPWYFNSDVTAIIDQISFEQLTTDRVLLRGVRGAPPPPTTKVGITARGGFQAEVHWFLVGLDIEKKASMLEAQIRHALGDTSRFHVLEFSTYGTPSDNPTDQNSATVDFRVFAQARHITDIKPSKFVKPIIDLIMCSYPGATYHLDARQGLPKPFFEYYVTLLPQADIHHVLHMHDSNTITIPGPSKFAVYPTQQPSEPVTRQTFNTDFGDTVKGPLGWIVHARSGDKGSNANVGFWVRYRDEYEWLSWLLSVETLKQLLAKEYNGKQIACSPNKSLVVS